MEDYEKTHQPKRASTPLLLNENTKYVIDELIKAGEFEKANTLISLFGSIDNTEALLRQTMIEYANLKEELNSIRFKDSKFQQLRNTINDKVEKTFDVLQASLNSISKIKDSAIKSVKEVAESIHTFGVNKSLSITNTLIDGTEHGVLSIRQILSNIQNVFSTAGENMVNANEFVKEAKQSVGNSVRVMFGLSPKLNLEQQNGSFLLNLYEKNYNFVANAMAAQVDSCDRKLESLQQKRDFVNFDSMIEILIDDEDPGIRRWVAEQGRSKDLDVLVNDEDSMVRAAVARCGRPQDLDILVNDENADVRLVVANIARFKDLDVLVVDKDPSIRMAVAWHGRQKDIDLLINDENPSVRKTAIAKQEQLDQQIDGLDEEARDMSAAKDVKDTPDHRQTQGKDER